MAEHLCVTCAQLRQGEPRIYDRKAVCEPCRSRLRSLIREIDEHYDALAGLHTNVINAGRWTDERGDHEEPVALALPVGPLRSGGGQRVSGSKDAPIPVSLDVMDLMLPARVPNPTDQARKWPTDQLGRLSVASVLDSWVTAMRDALYRKESLPWPYVYHLTQWLLDRLDDLCDRFEAIDDFAHEMRELASVLRRTVGASEVKPEHLDVPCRRCDLLDLHRIPGQDHIECGSCGELLTEDEYRRWYGLLVPSVRRVDEMAELPNWVWDTIVAMQKWENEHPPLFREGLSKNGRDVYEKVEDCGCSALALVPAEVREQARVLSDYLRQAS